LVIVDGHPVLGHGHKDMTGAAGPLLDLDLSHARIHQDRHHGVRGAHRRLVRGADRPSRWKSC
jgi:hypothetical protein